MVGEIVMWAGFGVGLAAWLWWGFGRKPPPDPPHL